MGRSINVMIVAPHDLSRKGLEAILTRSGSGIRLLGAFRTLDRAESELIRNHPHVLLLDDAITTSEGIWAILARFQQSRPPVQIIIVSSTLNPRYVQTLLRAGATGFVYRDDRLEETLLIGIETVAHGEAYASPRAAGLFIKSREDDRPIRLNQTDLSVLQLIDRGFSSKEIAAELDITVRTVYRVRNKIMHVLGAPTVEHIVAAARSQGLLRGEGSAGIAAR